MPLADQLARRNALLGRYATPQLRPLACGIAAGIYLLLAAAAVVLTLAATYAHGHLDVRGFWRALFVVFAALQALLLGVVGALLAGSAIQQEHAEKSIDFFRLLPLSPASRIVGILVGRNIVVLGLAAVNTLLVLGCGAAGGVSLRLVLEFLACAWIGGAAAMLFALLLSTHAPRRPTASQAGAAVLAAVFLLPYGIGLALNWHTTFPDGAYIPFFGWPVRLFVFLAALALYAGCWFVAGLCRRFGHERATVFSPAGARANLAGAAAILAGVLWSFARREPRVALLTFWCGTAVFLLLALFGSCRSWDDYQEAYGRSGRGPGWGSANRSNLAHGAGMILLWGALAALAGLRTGRVLPPVAIMACMAFWGAFLALWEMSVTHAACSPRIHLLTGFLAGFYLILPLVLGAVLDAPELMAISPMGYIVALGDRAAVAGGAPLFCAAGIAALLLVFIHRRYRAVA